MKQLFSRVSVIIHKNLTENILKVAIVLALLSTVYIFTENIFLAFIVAAIAKVILLGWDGRIFFGVGLLFLVFCPFLLAAENRPLAEDMAVYAYYMLALGVVMQIFEHGKESFFSKKKIREEILEIENFWNKKKILFLSLGIVFLTLCISTSAFYFFYTKVKTEIREDKKLLTEFLTQEKAKAEKVISSDGNSIYSVGQDISPIVVEEEEPVDWEKVSLSIENRFEATSDTQIIYQKLKKLGVLNIRTIENPIQNPNTVIEYCRLCNNVARELISIFPNQETITFLEVSEFKNEIIIHVGEDQSWLGLNDIILSILNGTTIPGKAGILKTEMQKAGFQVQSIGDAATKNYTKTILIFRTGNEEKASLVKNFLSNTYKNIELQENADLSVDVQVILGEISG